MTLIQETDALLKLLLAGEDAAVRRLYNAYRLVELRRRASRGKKTTARWKRRVTMRANGLIGREPAKILRAIAKDEVAEMLGER